MELNKTGQTNDQLRVTGALTYGGTLTVTNVSGALAANDSFQLFNAGSTSGVLSVIQTVAINPTNITCTASGESIALSWLADHTGWRLQVQTNAPNTGLGTNWVDVTGSTATNVVTMPKDISNGSVFYR